jgi:NADPH:quinone reductase
MHAVGVESFERGPQLIDRPRPEPGPGEVLVRVEHASLNGFDVAVAGGMATEWMEHRFPFVLGKDYAGRVEAVGEGVTSFRVGDEVFGELVRAYVEEGTFAEYAAVPVDVGIAKIPARVTHEAAGALALAGSTAYLAVEAIEPLPGQTVLVAGATGGVGSLAVQLVAGRGAEVVATARPGNESDFVTGLGATHVVDYTVDLPAQVRAIRPHGVDAAIHLAGDGRQLADLVAAGGRFASTLGLGPDELRDKPLEATAINHVPANEILATLASQVAAGRLRVPLSRTYRLEQVPQAIGDFAKGSLGKWAIAIAGKHLDDDAVATVRGRGHRLVAT